MTVKELIEKLNGFDENLEMEFEFDESYGYDDRGILEFHFYDLMKCKYDDKESILLSFR